MDRNSVIGLVLIGLILSVFAIMNQPSEEEIKKQEKEIALQEKKEKEAEKKKTVEAKKTASEVQSGNNVSKPLVAKKAELIRLENDKMIIDFSTKGGKVAAVRLKEFETYSDYAKKTKKEKKKADSAKSNPLLLFKDGDAVLRRTSQLYPSTAGTATARPMAVMISAAPTGPATLSIEALPDRPMATSA